jgi:hypothetical protein
MMSPDLAGCVSYQGMAADRGHPPSEQRERAIRILQEALEKSR